MRSIHSPTPMEVIATRRYTCFVAISLTLDDQTFAALDAKATAAGLSIENYLRRFIGLPLLELAAQTPPAPGTVEDLDAALNELFTSDTRPLPSTNLTYSREEIYDVHD